MKITIPKPCHENWELMTPEDKGRFCEVCSKTVRDFTNASDEEIINVFSTTSENICGNFNESQLDRDLQYSYLNSLLTKFAVGFVFTTAGFIALNAQKKMVNDSVKAEMIDEVILTGFTTKKECKQMVTGITTVTSEEHPAEKSAAQLREMTSGVKISDTIHSDRLILGGIHSVKIHDYRPLYVLDGKIISEKKFRKLDQKSIKTMNILKGASATAIYGEKGKNGVILVKTK
ncbi:TonB-dependent receptor plug domain-containing protein [uncultured Chryseobacterium sp.]|uniref:TonB-dependent receptor plug domain-containing protein n=1 Tax=uncultured Chryseobacterium sp. TaxID=259322 RepID=UPI00258588B5|nr:TonB-dependent receptor plug domain-containing protein [uncultured Chryseobacterium sp.]